METHPNPRKSSFQSVTDITQTKRSQGLENTAYCLTGSILQSQATKQKVYFWQIKTRNTGDFKRALTKCEMEGVEAWGSSWILASGPKRTTCLGNGVAYKTLLSKKHSVDLIWVLEKTCISLKGIWHLNMKNIQLLPLLDGIQKVPFRNMLRED